ncbi:MAG: NAD(P)-dependent oxidoreductase [Ginsengibacter sp.]
MNPDISKQKARPRILITGAGGLIGNSICHLLYKHDFLIMALYKSKPHQKLLWDYTYADIEKDQLQDILSYQNISAIIHCAAVIPNEQYSYEDCYKINTLIDKNISGYALKNDIKKIIFISTTKVYGISNKVINEDTELRIENLYSRAKANSEELFFNMKNTEITCLRINAPYHYSQKSNTVLKIFINKIVSGEDIVYHGTGKRQQDFTHVMDIAVAAMCSLKRNKPGIYNIASGNPVSMKNLGELILSKMPDSASKILSSGMPDTQEDHKAIFDITKAKKELGWQPSISLSDGIDEWIKYLNDDDRSFFRCAW